MNCVNASERSRWTRTDNLASLWLVVALIGLEEEVDIKYLVEIDKKMGDREEQTRATKKFNKFYYVKEYGF